MSPSRTQRAYQETHEDVRRLYFSCVEPNLSRAIRRDLSVDYKKLQVAIVNIMQFATVSRGAEMLNLETRDLIFTGEFLNSPIFGVLPVTKSLRRVNTYFRFTRMVDVSICGLTALQGWICVLRSHEVLNGNLFLQVVNNRLQGGTKMNPSTYSVSLQEMGVQCGIPALQEHSARRGGAGFHYFVLRRDLFFMYRAFSW